MIEANRHVLEKKLRVLSAGVSLTLATVKRSNAAIDNMPEGHELTTEQKTALMDRVSESATDLAEAYNDAVVAFTSDEPLEGEEDVI